MLIKLIVVNLSQCVCILTSHHMSLNNYILQPKYIGNLSVNHASIKAMRTTNNNRNNEINKQ